MANFCTNCGNKIRKEDKFCTNCGTKIINENNFCTRCGTKIRNGDKFCTNCGTKIDKPNIKQKNSLFKSVTESIEKNKAKIDEEMAIIAQEKEEEKKKLKMINEIFDSQEIKATIRKNNTDPSDVIHIKNNLKNKIINKKENMNNVEIKNFIKRELEKRRIKKEIHSKKIEENEMTRGGYCSLSCRHCYEEFFDGGGGIVGDFDSEGYVEYYCHIGHELSLGSFCEYYE